MKRDRFRIGRRRVGGSAATGKLPSLAASKIKERILCGGIGDGELRMVSVWGGVMDIMMLSRLKKEEMDS